MDIGKRIKELRIKSNLTQDELAAKLGLKKAAIHKYESGLVENIKRSTIQEMASIFDVSPCYILGWEDSNTSKYENLTKEETNLLDNFNKLNDIGKTEANKRVAELSYMPMYCDNKISTTKDNVVEITPKKELTYDDFDTVAAHNDGWTDDEIAEADRRILEDINKRR